MLFIHIKMILTKQSVAAYLQEILTQYPYTLLQRVLHTPYLLKVCICCNYKRNICLHKTKSTTRSYLRFYRKIYMLKVYCYINLIKLSQGRYNNIDIINQIITDLINLQDEHTIKGQYIEVDSINLGWVDKVGVT